jgi:RNA polymerase sigma factor for flagellar operon FliA
VGVPKTIEANLPLVRKIASDVRRSIGRLVEMDDLVAYGTQGLLEANERFDPRRGVAFSTFAYYRIRGAIYDGVREMGWRPHSRAQARQVEFETHANHVLQQAAEDAPPPGSGGEMEAVESTITQLATAYFVRLEAEAGVGVADTAPSAEAQVAAASVGALVREALATLPDKERELIRLMYFDEKSLTEAGAAIGLSKSWACRLHARALRLLGDELSRRGAGPAQPEEPRAR